MIIAVHLFERRLIDSLDALEMRHSKAGGGSIVKSDHGDSSSVGSPETGGGLNDKLRESLLRTSREHYRHMKQIEVLEASVDTLKLALKKSEASNRHLKLSLEELQASQAEDQYLPPMPPPPSHGATVSGTTAAQAAVVNTARSTHSNVGSSSNSSSSVPSHAPMKAVGTSTESKERPDRPFGHLDELFQVRIYYYAHTV